jgi:hypothetical protein
MIIVELFGFLCVIAVVLLVIWALIDTGKDYANRQFDKFQKRAYENKKKWDKESTRR